jgi:hypothetical protein
MSYLDKDTLTLKRAEIIEKYGEWTAHNIQLAENVYTIDNRIFGTEHKLRQFIQLASDSTGKPLSELRVLDLACLEGLYTTEFALQGAQALGIEGRTINIEKANFAKEALGLDNLEFVRDDVRNLSVEKYGLFDVVLCAGILYHIDVPDVFSLLERISQVCTRVAIIDTHVSLLPTESFTYQGNTYWGQPYKEFSDDATPEQKEQAVWASLDNHRSFWLDLASLYNFLQRIGFTSVYEVNVPFYPDPLNRRTIIAIKGQPVSLISAPLLNSIPLPEHPEVDKRTD